MKEEAELKAREEAERRLKEKEKKQEEEEQRTREREASQWKLNQEEAGGKETTASRSRLRIRAILEKQAKQRVCCSIFNLQTNLIFLFPQEEDEKIRQQKSESQDDMAKSLWVFR